MKAPILLSALTAVTFGPFAVLGTPVTNVNGGSAWTVSLQSRTKKVKPEDESLKAWIDRGQDVQVSLSASTKLRDELWV